ncbi:MAG: hypothetical protein ACLQBL_37570 [Polyangiaceae bacterium]|jgi:hypothetical protein
MIRSFFSMLLVGVAGLALAPGLLQGCSQTGVGDPCTPEQEYDPTFLGFAVGEVNVESKSFDCQTRLCLANHFQGRVTCPYGQTKTGAPPAVQSSGAPYNDADGHPIGACVLPFGGLDSASTGLPVASGEAVTGSASDTTDGALVEPQCVQRTANLAVYCSCRCANINNQTNDGAVYCACPSGYTCQQLVTPIGATDTGLTGAYCIQNGTQYDSINQCASASDDCDATSHNCGTFNGQ